MYFESPQNFTTNFGYSFYDLLLGKVWTTSPDP